MSDGWRVRRVVQPMTTLACYGLTTSRNNSLEHESGAITLPLLPFACTFTILNIAATFVLPPSAHLISDLGGQPLRQPSVVSARSPVHPPSTTTASPDHLITAHCASQPIAHDMNI